MCVCVRLGRKDRGGTPDTDNCEASGGKIEAVSGKRVVSRLVLTRARCQTGA